MRVRSLGWEDPLEEGMATHSSFFFLPTPGFLPGESHGQRSLAGYSPQGCKQQDMTEATYVITCNHPTKRSWWAFPQLRGDPVDSSHFEH